MPTFDEAARRAAAELHERTRGQVRTEPPVSTPVEPPSRRRLVLVAAVIVLIAGAVAVAIAASRPQQRMQPSTETTTGVSSISSSPSTVASSTTVVTTDASPTTEPPSTTTTVTARSLALKGTAQQLCDQAEQELDPNHSPWKTSVMLDRTMSGSQRWLFCRGDPAGIGAVIVLSTDSTHSPSDPGPGPGPWPWWLVSHIGGGPLLHAGDDAKVVVVDADVARVIVDSLAGEHETTSTTNDGGATWTEVTRTQTIPPTSAPSNGIVIDEQAPALAAGPTIFDGPGVMSQGPAVAFVPGIGLVGTLNYDDQRNSDLGVIVQGRKAPIGVRVVLQPVLLGGPDGRFYVDDVAAGTFTAYAINGGRAVRVAGVVDKFGCEDTGITATATNAVCGTARLPLGPVTAGDSWTLTSESHSTPSGTQLADGRAFEPGETRTVFADGTELWLIPFSWKDAENDTHFRTAVVVVHGGKVRVAEMPDSPATFDATRRVLYAWESIYSLVPYDLASLFVP